MQSTVLVSSFAEIAREKDIDRDTLQVIIEDVFRAMIKKRYGADDPEAFQGLTGEQIQALPPSVVEEYITNAADHKLKTRTIFVIAD